VKNFIAEGKALNWTNSTPALVRSGSIVAVGAIIGIAVSDIPPTTTGSVAIEGVYELPKASGAEIKQGEKVFAKEGVITKTAGDTYAGIAYETAAATALKVRIVINH
jgi:predicted RecA/RadA family phage recombinase